MEKTGRYLLLSVFLMLLSGCMEGRKDTLARRSLYERMGGEKALVGVVDDFVVNVVDDGKIKEEHKKHFREGDVAGLKRKLVDQIGEASQGPQKYKGKDMKRAHKGLGITDADFDALVVDLIKALNKNHVGQTEKDELVGMLANMRTDIVEK
jgi:hemoglobin